MGASGAGRGCMCWPLVAALGGAVCEMLLDSYFMSADDFRRCLETMGGSSGLSAEQLFVAFDKSQTGRLQVAMLCVAVLCVAVCGCAVCGCAV